MAAYPDLPSMSNNPQDNWERDIAERNIRVAWQRKIDEYLNQFQRLTCEDFDNGFLELLDLTPVYEVLVGSEPEPNSSLSSKAVYILPSVAAFVRKFTASNKQPITVRGGAMQDVSPLKHDVSVQQLLSTLGLHRLSTMHAVRNILWSFHSSAHWHVRSQFRRNQWRGFRRAVQRYRAPVGQRGRDSHAGQDGAPQSNEGNEVPSFAANMVNDASMGEEADTSVAVQGDGTQDASQSIPVFLLATTMKGVTACSPTLLLGTKLSLK